jgi:hypothetical protein
VWGVDKYMIDLSNHWSQRNLFDRYYAIRHERETTGVGEDARYWADPIVAYQMNWKGENFYTGNRVHVFVELDNKPLLEWIGKNKGRTVYLMLEHTRLERLKTVLAPRKLDTLTTPRDCNKFILVRTTL